MYNKKSVKSMLDKLSGTLTQTIIRTQQNGNLVNHKTGFPEPNKSALLNELGKKLFEAYSDFLLPSEAKKKLAGYSNRKIDLSKEIYDKAQKMSSHMTNKIIGALESSLDYRSTISQELQEEVEYLKTQIKYYHALTDNFLTLWENEHNGDAYYTINAAGGESCEVCHEYDGKTMKISEAIPSINIPPFHPNCNCKVEIVHQQSSQVTYDAGGTTESRKSSGADISKIDQIKNAVSILAAKNAGIDTDSKGNPVFYISADKIKFSAERKLIQHHEEMLQAAVSARLDVETDGTVKIRSREDYEKFIEMREKLRSGELFASLEKPVVRLIELKIAEKDKEALRVTKWEGAHMITGSLQGRIQKLCTIDDDSILHFDEHGYQRVRGTGLDEEPYMVALAEYYQLVVAKNGVNESWLSGYGGIFKVTFDDTLSNKKNYIYVTMGDGKAPQHTTKSMELEGENLYASNGDGSESNTLEFICNQGNRHPAATSKNMEDMDGTDLNSGYATKITSGAKITKIELLLDHKIDWIKLLEENERNMPY